MEELKRHYKLEHIFFRRNDGYTDLFIFKNDSVSQYDGVYFLIDEETDNIYISGESSKEDLDYVHRLFPTYTFHQKKGSYTNRFVVIKKNQLNVLISPSNINREKYLEKEGLYVFEIVLENEEHFILWDTRTKSKIKVTKQNLIKNKKIKDEEKRRKQEEYNRLRQEAIDKKLIESSDRKSLIKLKEILGYKN